MESDCRKMRKSLGSSSSEVQAYGIPFQAFRPMELRYQFTISRPHGSLGSFYYCHYFTFLHYLSDFYGEVFDKVVFC